MCTSEGERWPDASDKECSWDGGNDLMREALEEQICTRRLLHVLQDMPGICEDLGLTSAPTSMVPLSRDDYAKAFRPM